MTVIQFVGLGTMGTPMVGRLVDAGHRVYVSDVDEEASRRVADQSGAVHTADPRTSSDADVLILMLPNSDIVSTVLGDSADPASLVRSRRAGTIVVDMGSSRPDATKRNAEKLAALGLELVDAPVSGGPLKAAAGELTIMVGTSDETMYDRVLPVLQSMGSAIQRTGPVGSAHALKALNNLLSVIGLVGGLEVLSVGTKFGLEPQLMLDVINRSTGRNHATEVKIGPQVLTHNWNVGFSLALTVKDVHTALALAASEGIDIPVSSAAVAIAQEALDALGTAAPDQSHIGEYLEKRNGVRFDGR
ncbi:NAD(P)-dependent oxidoreductase [Streptomyces sp. NBC_00063]|uniref:NAD(P)-dependent oxidoreductase n=1 Tax=Streptomyces sp. NBC_00063 TaxID=2975638 RepID=UPI003D74DB62